MTTPQFGRFQRPGICGGHFIALFSAVYTQIASDAIVRVHKLLYIVHDTALF